MAKVQEQPGQNAVAPSPNLILPRWITPQPWLWGFGAGLALIASLYLALARPNTNFSWQADKFGTSALETTNIYGAETDAANQRFAWTQPNGVTLALPATSQNQQTVKVTIRARGASAAGGPDNPTSVKANDQPIGQIKPVAGQAAFQDFSFSFVPAYRDDHALVISLDTPSWKPKGDSRSLGLALQSVSLDINEVWLPITGRRWLTVTLPVLLVLGLAAWPARRRRPAWRGWFDLLGLGVLLIVMGIAAFWLLLLSRVGYNGQATNDFFWLQTACAFYLFGFVGWLVVAGWSFGARPRSLLSRAMSATVNWRQVHPGLTALLAIFSFNLTLMLVFITKVAVENNGLWQIFRFWDGPEYIVIAHGFYDTHDSLLKISFLSHHSYFYWTAHFPGYPLLLMAVQPLLGWVLSPLVLNLVISTLFAWVFYHLLRDFGYASQPLWVALVSLVLPIRWIIYHNVSGSEPIFMLCQVTALYLFKKERYWLAALAGVGAVWCRPPGMFLWLGFMLFLAWDALSRAWVEDGGRLRLANLVQKFNWRAFGPLLLMPLALVSVFGLFAWRYGDFWAYFKITEDVTHIYPMPLPVLASGALDSPGVFYSYILETVGLVFLWRQRRYDVFWVGFASFVYTLFLLHEDVLRYSIPFFALVVLLPFAEYLSGRVARWLAAPVLLGLLFYSWGVLHGNLMNMATFDAMRQILGLN